jgi:hypothetical protein
MTAAAIPIAAPTSGPAVCPDALAAVHRNSVVSRPSRPTDRNAVSVSAPAPIAAARSARAPSFLSTVVLRTAASKMVTTSPASSPSRSPISRLGTLSAQVTMHKARLT